MQANDLPDEEASKRFLNEGAKSYVAAKCVLELFEQDVQKKCRELAKRRLAEVGDVLGLGWLDDHLKSHYNLDRKRAGFYATLGIYVCGVTTGAATRPSWFCGLYWGEEGAGRSFGIVISCDLNEQRFADALRSALGDAEGVEQGRGYVGLWQTLPVEEADSFPEKLDAALKRWIQAWKEAAGLQASAAR